MLLTIAAGGTTSISGASASVSGTTVTLTMTTTPLTTSDDIGYDYWVGDADVTGTTNLPHAASAGSVNTSAAAGTSQSWAYDASAIGLVSTAGDGNNNTLVIKPWVRKSGSATKIYYSGEFADLSALTRSGASTPPVENETDTVKHGVIVCTEGVSVALTENGAASMSGENYTYAAGDVGNTVTFTFTASASGMSNVTDTDTTGTVAAAAVSFLGVQLGGSGLISSGVTQYINPSGGTYDTTEDNRKYVVPAAITITDMRVAIRTPQHGSGSLVVTLMKNGVATDVAVTISASATAGDYGDSGSASFSAGDLLDFELANAVGGNSGAVQSVSVKGS